jgi:xanthine dehydrogenase accessory factor
MKNIFEDMVQLLVRGENFALATIIARSKSAPRTVGARMLVRADGTIIRSIGGGLLEAQVQQTAAEVFKTRNARIRDFLLTGEDPEMSMICGGQTEVLIEFVDAADSMNLKIHQELLEVRSARQRAWLLTAIQSKGEEGLTTGRCLIKSDGSFVGVAAIGAAVGVGTGSPIGLFSDKSDTSNDLLDVASSRDPVLVAWGRQRLLIEPISSETTAYIFGAGHISQELAPLTKRVGFRTVVLDDRQEFANRERFETADQVIVINSFDRALDELEIDQDSYLVIVTRGHIHDETVLAQALRTNAGYIGMIGSRTKRDATFRTLASEGFTSQDFARVYSPIGLSIGAESPEEIAVSIVGELIKVRAERK